MGDAPKWCFNPESHCERCSWVSEDGEEGTCTHHGGGRCTRDPTLPVNVIAAHFKAQGSYVGIVWEAIANGAVRALENAGYRIVEEVHGDV